MTTSVVVWAQENDPPETVKNILYWQKYSQDEQTLSIPRYLEEHAERLRVKYISFIYDLGQSSVDGKRVVEHMDKGDGFSFWWMAKLSEKSPFKSKRIYHCLLLMALEEILLEKKPSELVLHSSDSMLIQAIKILCQNIKINFICRSRKKYFWQNLSVFGPNNALLNLVHGILSLRHIVRRWPFRKLHKPQWFSGENNIFMCSYFFHMDSASCEEGRFLSHQWEDLPKYFHDSERRTNWLHNYVYHLGGPDVKTGLAWFRRFNKDAEKQGYHCFLETYLSWRGLIRALKDWLWLNAVSWRLRKIRHAFTPKGSVAWLWPLLKNDWFASLTGPSALFNCLWVELFDAALKDMPPQKTGFYLWENQGWEIALLRAWQRNGNGEIIGVQHATAPFWHLCHFDDPRSLTLSGKSAKPLPDRLALNGPMAWKTFTKEGYPAERLVEVEAVRFQYLLDFKLGERKRQYDGPIPRRLSGNNTPLKVLVLGDFTFNQTLKMLHCIKHALDFVDSEISLTLKPHPVCSIRKSDFSALSFAMTDKPLGDILQDFDVAFSSNSTSAGLDALHAGLPVMVYLDGEDFNHSPLRGIESVRFVSNAEELASAINENISGTVSSVSGDYFWLDNNFLRWNRVLSGAGVTDD